MTALKGYEQMISALQNLGREGSNCVRTAQRDACKLQKASCVSAAPVDSGATRDAIKIQSAKRKRNRIAIMVSLGADFFQGKTFYAAFVLFGHKIGKRIFRGKKQKAYDKLKDADGSGRKFVPADNWMKVGWDSTAEEAAKLWETNMKNYLETASDKAGGLK